MAGYNSVKRILKRSKEEVKASLMIAKKTSVKDALAVFNAKIEIQKMVRNGFQEPPKVKKKLIRKHKALLSYFNQVYKEYAKSYDFDMPLPEDESENRECVWICWWQGLDQAPDIVKACVQAIRNNCHTHKVVVITDENYKQYVNIPEWLEEKKERGIISKTHFSDLLRLSLLAEHGGIWLDSTLFCTESIDDLFRLPVWSIRRDHYKHASVACGKFANYALGCNYENRRIFAVIRDFWIHYWTMHDMLIDYLMTDYIIVLVQKYDPRIKEAFRKIEANNPACDELLNVLGQPFDEKKWTEMKSETTLFKLTWKADFPEESQGRKTFYGELLKK